MIHKLFEADGRFATGGKDGQGFAAEVVDDGGGVDAAAAGRIVGGEDVGAVVKGEAVDGDGAVDGGIHSEGKYQIAMVAYEGIGGWEGGGVEGRCRLDESGCSAAWLARLLGVQEVPGSNPGSPTI